MIFSGYQLIKKIEHMATDIASSNLSFPSISELISNNAIVYGVMLNFSRGFWLVTIYFQPYIVTRKDSRHNNVLIKNKIVFVFFNLSG